MILAKLTLYLSGLLMVRVYKTLPHNKKGSWHHDIPGVHININHYHHVNNQNVKIPKLKRVPHYDDEGTHHVKININNFHPNHVLTDSKSKSENTTKQVLNASTTVLRKEGSDIQTEYTSVTSDDVENIVHEDIIDGIENKKVHPKKSMQGTDFGLDEFSSKELLPLKLESELKVKNKIKSVTEKEERRNQRHRDFVAVSPFSRKYGDANGGNLKQEQEDTDSNEWAYKDGENGWVDGANTEGTEKGEENIHFQQDDRHQESLIEEKYAEFASEQPQADQKTLSPKFKNLMPVYNFSSEHDLANEENDKNQQNTRKDVSNTDRETSKLLIDSNEWVAADVEFDDDTQDFEPEEAVLESSVKEKHSEYSADQPQPDQKMGSSRSKKFVPLSPFSHNLAHEENKKEKEQPQADEINKSSRLKNFVQVSNFSSQHDLPNEDDNINTKNQTKDVTNNDIEAVTPMEDNMEDLSDWNQDAMDLSSLFGTRNLVGFSDNLMEDKTPEFRQKGLIEEFMMASTTPSISSVGVTGRTTISSMATKKITNKQKSKQSHPTHKMLL